jgi:hypothetical protein
MPPPITPSSRVGPTRLPDNKDHQSIPSVSPPPATTPAQVTEVASAANPRPVQSAMPNLKQPSRVPSAVVLPAANAPAAVTLAAPPPSAATKIVGKLAVAAETPLIAKAELKVGHPPAQGEPHAIDGRPAILGAEPATVEKPKLKTDDPFGGLESLEAEMARLLGRDKSS